MDESSINLKNFRSERSQEPSQEPRRRSISGFSGRNGVSNAQILPPPPPEDEHIQRKRQRSIPHPQHDVKKPRKETDLVDRIWHDIDEEQREKSARRKEEAKRREKPIHSPRDYLPLTAVNLRNFKNEDSTISDFIHRKGMVDRLLGYKMLLGKMENCGTLGYEKMNEGEIKELSAEWLKLFFPEKDSQESQHQKVGPRTPPSPKDDGDPASEGINPNRPRRGPKTPPGSPGVSNVNDQASVNRRELIEQLAKNFGISSSKVEETLGNGLDKALEDCSKKIKNELMETFKEQLQSQYDKKPKLCDDLSDQMELVSDDSLSVDLKIVKKEEPDGNMVLYHMAIPPPPIPPPIQPPYPYYPQTGPPVYQYAPPPPPPPQFQQNMMCYPPPPQQLVPNAPPPQMHYQMPPTQQYPSPLLSVNNMVLPPVNIPPPPIGVRIDTPMPQSIPPVQALPPVGIPPLPIQTKLPPPPLPQKMQTAPPPPQPPVPPPGYAGDCWRSGPPPTHLPNNSSDSWQQQPPPPVASGGGTVPVSSAPTVVNVQSTLFSALGLHKFPPPPPPPPPPVSGNSASISSLPFSSLSGPPPPPPPPVVGLSPSCSSMNFAPPLPPPNQSSNNILSPSASSGYRRHGHNNGRGSQYPKAFSNY